MTTLLNRLRAYREERAEKRKIAALRMQLLSMRRRAERNLVKLNAHFDTSPASAATVGLMLEMHMRLAQIDYTMRKLQELT